MGREKFPADAGLLFSEINYYLVKGELASMISNLEEALAQEPDNISVILTLGQVYDQLQVKSYEEGDREKAQEYFDGAYKYYQKALEMDPSNFDLFYSIGALYYNKAANMTSALNEVANDFSSEGTKKYEAIKTEMASLFEEALPYFLKADELNGQDRNTLIALKEIFARKDDFEKSNAYKDRLESLPE
jgi:tetratricopeptide (TPR) repeat protein